MMNVFVKSKGLCSIFNNSVLFSILFLLQAFRLFAFNFSVSLDWIFLVARRDAAEPTRKACPADLHGARQDMHTIHM